MEAWTAIDGVAASGLLIIADHASNRVPDDIDLGIDPALLETHIAIDLGVSPLARALASDLGCPAILANVSRLVADFNREENAPAIVPLASDGHAIPGNACDHRGRINRFWRPYHDKVSQMIAEYSPKLLISLHSFTPRLAQNPNDQRPWEVGILYNENDRAARIAIPLLAATGATVGDQQPYSGRLLNATMNRHGEAKGIAYLGIEMRQDQIGDSTGVARWSAVLAPVILACRDGVAR